MKNFLTPLQYNEIFSASTDIVINGNINEEKSYLLDKCKALKAKNVELEKKLTEALNGALLKRYNKEKEDALEKLRISVEALEEINQGHLDHSDIFEVINLALEKIKGA